MVVLQISPSAVGDCRNHPSCLVINSVSPQLEKWSTRSDMSGEATIHPSEISLARGDFLEPDFWPGIISG